MTTTACGARDRRSPDDRRTARARDRAVVERRIRLAVSDAVLLVVTLNVLASGVVDWSRGAPVTLPLPRPFTRWHLDAGLVLVVYLVVHVWHRRKRIRRSTIR